MNTCSHHHVYQLLLIRAQQQLSVYILEIDRLQRLPHRLESFEVLLTLGSLLGLHESPLRGRSLLPLVYAPSQRYIEVLFLLLLDGLSHIEVLQHIGVALGEVELGCLSLVLVTAVQVLSRVHWNSIVLHQMEVHVLNQSFHVLHSVGECLQLRPGDLFLGEEILSTGTHVTNLATIELHLGNVVHAAAVLHALTVVPPAELIGNGVVTLGSAGPVDYVLRDEGRGGLCVGLVHGRRILPVVALRVVLLDFDLHPGLPKELLVYGLLEDGPSFGRLLLLLGVVSVVVGQILDRHDGDLGCLSHLFYLVSGGEIPYPSSAPSVSASCDPSTAVRFPA
jgi:hypothetical protein